MDRSDACEDLRRNWDLIRLGTAARVLNELYALDPETVCEKIVRGEKFGPFDIHGTDWSAELREEVVDAVAYHLFTILSGEEE